MADSPSNWKTKNFNLAEEIPQLQQTSDKLAEFLVVLNQLQTALDSTSQLVSAYGAIGTNAATATLSLTVATVKAIIEQITGTGLYWLPIIPDFKRGDDYISILNSVGGGFQGFENRVTSKMLDFKDINAPVLNQSNFKGIILTAGAETPASFIPVLQSFLRLFGLLGQTDDLLPPTPVNVRVFPINQDEYVSLASRSQVQKSLTPIVTTAKNAFTNAKNAPYDALVVRWELPPSNTRSSPGIRSSVMELFRDFTTKFIIERSELPYGYANECPTTYRPDPMLDQNVSVMAPVIDPSGGLNRKFEHKFLYDLSAFSALDAGIRGLLNGNQFAFIDTLVEPNKQYYYRIRSYSGNESLIQNYINNTTYRDESEKPPVFRFFIETDKLGKPSDIVSGFIPPILPDGFDAYNDIFSIFMLGYLLNFDYPIMRNPTPDEVLKSIGFGTLENINPSISTYKMRNLTFKEFVDNTIVKSEIRKITNKVTDALYKNPNILLLISDLFSQSSDNVKNAVTNDQNSTLIYGSSWKPDEYGWLQTVPPPNLLLSDRKREEYVKSYLDMHAPLVVVTTSGSSTPTILESEPDYFKAPLPLDFITAQDRVLLAQMINLCLGSLRRTDNHLSWYSVSVSQLVPSINGVFYEIEQFLAAILKAAEDAIKAIKDAIKNIKRRIAQFQEIVVLIKQIVDALNITVNFSALVFEGTGSNSDAVRAIQNATDKPSDEPNSLPQGYYVGLVAMVAYPSGESPKALDALTSFLGF